MTGSGDNNAKLWEAQSGRELKTFAGHRESVSSVAFSPDGTKILTGSGDRTAAIFVIDSLIDEFRRFLISAVARYHTATDHPALEARLREEMDVIIAAIKARQVADARTLHGVINNSISQVKLQEVAKARVDAFFAAAPP